MKFQHKGPLTLMHSGNPLNGKLTAAVTHTQIGKPPDVTEPDRVTDQRQEEVHLVAPRAALRRLLIRILSHSFFLHV